MFERFLRFVEVRRAIERGRLEHAFELLEDREIRDHKKAAELREMCAQKLRERADKRLELGEESLVRQDLDLLARRCPEDHELPRRREALARRQREKESEASSRAESETQVRHALESGELEIASARIAAAEAAGTNDTACTALRRQLDAQRERARAALGSVTAAHEAGELDRAIETLRTARSLWVAAPGRAELARDVAEARVRACLADLETGVRGRDLLRLVRRCSADAATLPELAQSPRFAELAAALTATVEAEVASLCGSAELAELTLRARELATALETLPGLEPVCAGVALVSTGLAARDRGQHALAAEALEQGAARLRCRPLADLAAECRKAETAGNAVLDAVRARVAEGDPTGGRALLLEALERWPVHEALREELAVLERDASLRAERLAEARKLASDGRLAAARQCLVVLAVPGSDGDEARLLLKNVQGRIEQVERGIGQVHKALHGRDSASREGVRHSLVRLEQLELVQKDSAELAKLISALRAEIEGLDAIEVATDALAAGDAARVADAVAKLGEMRGQLVEPNRLRARVLELADRIHAKADGLVASGRPAAALAWGKALLACEAVDAAEPAQRLELERKARERLDQAEAKLDEAKVLLAQRGTDAAEEALGQARSLASDCPRLARQQEELGSLRRQEARLREVEALAQANDLAGAHRRLHEMPPTPPPLRTRIFDLKQSLARAQGLDHGFLLRVDEGGELLVLRSDSLTIGNLRDGSSDLALLANLAGRHARLVRAMSFHGGMQDQIVAERGDVAVNGERIASRCLRHGDRVRLGTKVEFLYEMPVARSLTARLTWLAGLQVGGASRVLLLKDRGRDGRILLGPTQDCHVRVPGAAGEVEIYASRDGQIRVKLDGMGEMNDASFKDEHPIVAGVLVRALGITFSLHPWG